jgi:hypothetical protein
MRPSKEKKPNRGFKMAFRAGVFIIIILSLLISWISVSVLRSIEGNKKCEGKSEVSESPYYQDTVFVERVKEVKITDTVYKYIPAPVVQTVTKSEDLISPKKDTF